MQHPLLSPRPGLPQRAAAPAAVMFGAAPAALVKSPEAVVRRLNSELGATVEYAGLSHPVCVNAQDAVVFRSASDHERMAGAFLKPIKVMGQELTLIPLALSRLVKLETRSGKPSSVSPAEVCEAVDDVEGITLIPGSSDGLFEAPTVEHARLLCSPSWGFSVRAGQWVVGFSAVWAPVAASSWLADAGAQSAAFSASAAACSAPAAAPVRPSAPPKAVPSVAAAVLPAGGAVSAAARASTATAATGPRAASAGSAAPLASTAKPADSVRPAAPDARPPDPPSRQTDPPSRLADTSSTAAVESAIVDFMRVQRRASGSQLGIHLIALQLKPPTKSVVAFVRDMMSRGAPIAMTLRAGTDVALSYTGPANATHKGQTEATAAAASRPSGPPASDGSGGSFTPLTGFEHAVVEAALASGSKGISGAALGQAVRSRGPVASGSSVNLKTHVLDMIRRGAPLVEVPGRSDAWFVHTSFAGRGGTAPTSSAQPTVNDAGSLAPAASRPALPSASASASAPAPAPLDAKGGVSWAVAAPPQSTFPAPPHAVLAPTAVSRFSAPPAVASIAVSRTPAPIVASVATGAASRVSAPAATAVAPVDVFRAPAPSVAAPPAGVGVLQMLAPVDSSAAAVVLAPPVRPATSAIPVSANVPAVPSRVPVPAPSGGASVALAALTAERSVYPQVRSAVVAGSVPVVTDATPSRDSGAPLRRHAPTRIRAWDEACNMQLCTLYVSSHGLCRCPDPSPHLHPDETALALLRGILERLGRADYNGLCIRHLFAGMSSEGAPPAACRCIGSLECDVKSTNAHPWRPVDAGLKTPFDDWLERSLVLLPLSPPPPPAALRSIPLPPPDRAAVRAPEATTQQGTKRELSVHASSPPASAAATAGVVGTVPKPAIPAPSADAAAAASSSPVDLGAVVLDFIRSGGPKGRASRDVALHVKSAGRSLPAPLPQFVRQLNSRGAGVVSEFIPGTGNLTADVWYRLPTSALHSGAPAPGPLTGTEPPTGRVTGESAAAAAGTAAVTAAVPSPITLDLDAVILDYIRSGGQSGRHNSDVAAYLASRGIALPPSIPQYVKVMILRGAPIRVVSEFLPGSDSLSPEVWYKAVRVPAAKGREPESQPRAVSSALDSASLKSTAVSDVGVQGRSQLEVGAFPRLGSAGPASETSALPPLHEQPHSPATSDVGKGAPLKQPLSRRVLVSGLHESVTAAGLRSVLVRAGPVLDLAIGPSEKDGLRTGFAEYATADAAASAIALLHGEFVLHGLPLSLSRTAAAAWVGAWPPPWAVFRSGAEPRASITEAERTSSLNPSEAGKRARGLFEAAGCAASAPAPGAPKVARLADTEARTAPLAEGTIGPVSMSDAAGALPNPQPQEEAGPLSPLRDGAEVAAAVEVDAVPASAPAMTGVDDDEVVVPRAVTAADGAAPGTSPLDSVSISLAVAAPELTPELPSEASAPTGPTLVEPLPEAVGQSNTSGVTAAATVAAMVDEGPGGAGDDDLSWIWNQD